MSNSLFFVVLRSSQSEILLFNLMSKLCADVTVKVPQVDSVLFSTANNGGVVCGAEHGTLDWVSVPDESLEVIWGGLGCFVVPHLKHRVLTSC
jgi:hypothetical protein